MKTSDVLNRAADLIEGRGWTRGADAWNRPEEEDGPLCLEGGIMAALGVSVDFKKNAEVICEIERCPAYRAVVDYLGSEGALWKWNDAYDFDTFTPVHTAAEVIEVLRAAAVIEEARESGSPSVLTAVPVAAVV